MTITTTERDLVDRIDELSARVEHLTELIEADRAGRRALADLATEAMPLARSAYEQLAVRLDASTLDIEAVGALLLRLGEAAPELERMLDTLESGSSLLREISGLSGDAMRSLIEAMERLEARGYVTWAQGGLEVVDRIVTSFDEDDIAALGDNVVLIFETIKEMTQPDVMHMLQRSARLVREDAEQQPPKLSMFRLLREMRDPEVKLGIHRMLTLLKGMAAVEESDRIETQEARPEPSEKEER